MRLLGIEDLFDGHWSDSILAVATLLHKKYQHPYRRDEEYGGLRRLRPLDCYQARLP
jgi:hypothetical protein